MQYGISTWWDEFSGYLFRWPLLQLLFDMDAVLNPFDMPDITKKFVTNFWDNLYLSIYHQTYENLATKMSVSV